MIRPTWEKPLYVFRELGTFRSTRRRFAAQRLFDSKNVAQDPRRDNAFIGHNAIGHNVARDSWATSWQQQLACTRKQRYRRSRVFLFYSYKIDSTGYELRRLIVPRDCSITILAGVFTSRLRRNLIVISIILKIYRICMYCIHIVHVANAWRYFKTVWDSRLGNIIVP